jgi:hypothetical protein
MRHALPAAAALLLAAPSASHAQHQPVPELRGSVAISIMAMPLGDAQAIRTCRVDATDLERRAGSLLNKTRLIVLTQADVNLRQRPEYLRLQRVFDAAVARVRAADPAQRREAERAANAAARALAPWDSPLIMRITSLPIIIASGCAEAITVEVLGSTEPAHMASSVAETPRLVRLFSIPTVIASPVASIQEERVRMVERAVSGFANAWAEANR